MKKIKKADIDRLADLGRQFEEHLAAIDQIMANARSEIEDLVDKANDVRKKAHGVIEDITNEMDSYYDDRSEKWQEGDNGQAYQEWKNEVEQVRDDMDEDFTYEITEDPERGDWVQKIIDGVQDQPE